MSFQVGSLVRARGREWVVLPESSEQTLRLKPLGGSDIEIATVLPTLEKIEPASFALPDPRFLGDARSARLLRDAVRIGFRSSAGPFRSMAAVAVEPRPYQLVPLLMALRLEPVRLLIADDVGIGKTVEAALVAKELIARGEAEQLCVLCPPHLAEQWQAELAAKFDIDAALVLPSTVSKLERELMGHESIFEHYPVTIVSLDYIKQTNRRDDFLRACPDLVIVDEAHTCTQGGQASQMRYQLLKRLSAKPSRHLLLVTATPHSGNDQSFRSLLSLLDADFENLPEDLGGEHNRPDRERLARHFVQRRRADVSKHFIEDTPFPKRLESEQTYKLHPDYRKLLESAVDLARDTIRDATGTEFQQRIRWWSALALLRSISSSPDAALTTLSARANAAGGEDLQAIEDIGKRSVLDLVDSEPSEGIDVSPGSDAEEGDTPLRRRLMALKRQAETITPEKDHKLQKLASVVSKLVSEGNSPIVFCKYIATAEYVAGYLRSTLRQTEVVCVTGQLPHDEREERVYALSEHERRVLVCTDCLSEGINLQEWFDAVVHADLAWSPTRHEQREGRVDRFNQKTDTVKIVTVYGEDNGVDGIVFEVLLRKHKAIRSALGISVPVPVDSAKALEAIFEALLLKGARDFTPSLFTDVEMEEQRGLNLEWQQAADRETRNRTLFAQNAIKVDEVATELREVREALGAPADVERFFRESVLLSGGKCENKPMFQLDLEATPRALKDAVGFSQPFRASFQLPSPRGAVQLSRTSPWVERLASHVLDAALSGEDAIASRCGAIATDCVTELTCLLLLRFRFQIVSSKRELLAEDAAFVSFRGMATSPTWLQPEDLERLLAAESRSNLAPDFQRSMLRSVLAQFDSLRRPLRELARMRGERLLESHRRVRRALDGTTAAREVRPQGEPDILGAYLFVPAGDVG